MSLEFCFTGANDGICNLGPTELIKWLARSSYLVFCPRRLCRPFQQGLSSVYTVDGEGKVDLTADTEVRRLVVIRQLYGNVVARCVSLMQVGKYGGMHRDDKIDRGPTMLDPDLLYHSDVILRADECWSFCNKAALSSSNKGRLPVKYIM